MKKNGLVILLVVLLLSFLSHGCSNNRGEGFPIYEGSETTSVETMSVEATSATPDKSVNVVTRTNLYEITQREGLYSYALFDKDGNIAKEGTNLTKLPNIQSIENGVIRLTIQAGTGIGTQWGFYYDQESNTTSEIYHCIFDEKNGIVAHATKDKIVVESIFKTEDFYYKEIDSFQQPFSVVAFPFISAEFSEYGDKICVSYYSGTDYVETTEIFSIFSLAQGSTD